MEGGWGGTLLSLFWEASEAKKVDFWLVPWSIAGFAKPINNLPLFHHHGSSCHVSGLRTGSGSSKSPAAAASMATWKTPQRAGAVGPRGVEKMGGILWIYFDYPPGRFTWNLQITHLERNMIFQPSMIMFHVKLQGCILLKKTHIPWKLMLKCLEDEVSKNKNSQLFRGSC